MFHQGPEVRVDSAPDHSQTQTIPMGDQKRNPFWVARGQPFRMLSLSLYWFTYKRISPLTVTPRSSDPNSSSVRTTFKVGRRQRRSLEGCAIRTCCVKEAEVTLSVNFLAIGEKYIVTFRSTLTRNLVMTFLLRANFCLEPLKILKVLLVLSSSCCYDHKVPVQVF